MKSVLIYLILNIPLLVPNLAYSQNNFKKGAFMLGGGSQISQIVENHKYDNKQDKFKEININLESNIGYFFSTNLVSGFKISHNSVFERYFDNTSWQNTTFYTYLRYYTKYSIFSELDLGYGFYNIRTSGSGLDHNYGPRLNIGIGYSVILSRSVALEPSINYRFSILDFDDEFIIDAYFDKILKNELYFMITLQIFLKNEINQ